MSEPNPQPPEHISEEFVTELRESNDRQLREIIHYAQQLLEEHSPEAEAIEPREGEEIVRIDDQGDHTTVIVKRPDESGEARGPFAYLVQHEPDVESENGKYKWHYLGRVTDNKEDK